MGGGDLRADARLAFGYDWVAEANHVNPSLQHGIGDLCRERRISEHHRTNRVCAWQDCKSDLTHSLAEELCVRFKFIAQSRGLGEQLQHLERRSGDARRKGVAKKIGP